MFSFDTLSVVSEFLEFDDLHSMSLTSNMFRDASNDAYILQKKKLNSITMDDVIKNNQFLALKYIIWCSPSMCIHNYIITASVYGNYDFVKFMMTKITGPLNGALFYASCNGYANIVSMLLSRASNHYQSMMAAIEESHMEVISLLVPCCPACYWPDSIARVARSNNIKMVKFLMACITDSYHDAIKIIESMPNRYEMQSMLEKNIIASQKEYDKIIH